jgi:hypothetical protein
MREERLLISRRGTGLLADGTPTTRPIEDWRCVDAYVLLADPGAGKSELFMAEAAATGGAFCSARDFIALGIDEKDAGKTLFIDGLDEMRAGAADGRTPLDQIRTKLKALGRPRFRLSCREHDWRSKSDLDALKLVAPNEAVAELHLEPLSRGEQEEILVSRAAEVADPQDFLRQADEHGLSGLFGNPLLLDLTIRAVASNGGWPASRRDIYMLACRQLAEEQSDAHREIRPPGPGDIDRMLDDAGLLCAVLLLSGKSALTRRTISGGPGSTLAWQDLPDGLKLHDARAALASKVFVTVGDESTPRHRSIAEYLAARAISLRLQAGLPLGRVLALMQGGDGITVEPLRGLHGWLTVHHVADRAQLIRLDPLATTLNGDPSAFSATEKRALLDALRDTAQRNPWFRNGQWTSYPFAPLASAELRDTLAEVLSDHSTADEHQALVDCVLDAMNHGQPMPDLAEHLEGWVMDPSAQFRNRVNALQAWKRVQPFNATRTREWLDRLHRGETADLDARLAGELLFDLYPGQLRPDEVLQYWPRPGSIGRAASLPRFWYGALIEQTPPKDFGTLADSWLRLNPQAHHQHHEHDRWALVGRILAQALAHAGDTVSDDRLYSWLGMGVDEYGFSRLDKEDSAAAARWLTDQPDRVKCVVAHGWLHAPRLAAGGRPYYWEAESRLHGARLPSDWLQWLLDVAASVRDEDLAKYCFSVVAHAVVDPPGGFDVPSMERVIQWVAMHSDTWPQAQAWLDQEWTCQVEGDWRADNFRRSKRNEAERLAQREKRRAAISPHLDALVRGDADPWLLQRVTLAYHDLLTDIHGDTPEQRVQELLVSDSDTAASAIQSLSHVLGRADLPSADDVLKADAAGKYHYLRPAALLAAKFAHERDERAVDTWPEPILSTLVAFWLTDGTGDIPGWYRRAVETRPADVAPLYLRYAKPRLRRKGPLMVTGLWALSREAGHESLARLVLPELLSTFPQRATEQARRELDGSLLVALHLLDAEIASQIVRSKRDHPSIDVAQRISWLVAGLCTDGDAAVNLAMIVGKSKRRIVLLGTALHEQGSVERALKHRDPALLSRLVELLASITPTERPADGWVTPAHHRSDTLKALIGTMAADPKPAAAEELRRLIELPALENWRNYLRYQLMSQQAVSRETHYVHARPDAVALTLANSSPASRADLQALAFDHLRDIERHLRGAETFALKQFWKSVEGRSDPDSENDCRDLLLERLQPRLAPIGVTASSERRTAADKRADIRIEYTASGGSIAVPVEVKKENNESLWVAWQVQLQALYAIDPAADGYGIYLVLWFGVKPRQSPEGDMPTSAVELQQLLEACIPARDHASLKILVMDLSLAKSTVNDSKTKRSGPAKRKVRPQVPAQVRTKKA